MTEMRDRPDWKPCDEEARQQPAHQPMLEMDLHDVRRVAAVRQHAAARRRWRGPARRAPLVEPLAALARARAQIVEGVLPAGILGEGGMRRDRAGRSSTLPTGSPRARVERQAGARQARRRRRAADRRDRRRRARATSRATFCRSLLLLQQPLVARLLLVIHLGAGAREPLGVGLLLDRLGERLGLRRGRCRRPPAASVIRFSITWPAEPSCSRIISVLRTSASSTMSASRCS